MADETEDREWELRPDVDAVISYAVERRHQHIERAHIVGVGRPKAAKRHGKDVWASLKKPSPLERVLYEEERIDYILVVALDVWEELSEDYRRALIDHELSHAGGLDLDRDEWTLVGHDIEEFANVVRRHGAWRGDVQAFLAATRDVDPAQGIIPGLIESLRPRPGSGVESVTLSSGGRSVTLGRDPSKDTVSE